MTTSVMRDISRRPAAPRIPPVDPAEMTEEQRALAGVGASNVIRTLVRRDDLLGKMNPIGVALLASERTTARDRELAILRVALRTGSAYEWGNHALAARAVGVSDAELRALTDPEASWPDADAALLTAVDELCADDCVSGATWAALRATRDDGEIIEFLMLIGFYRMMAGILNSAGVPSEEGRPAYGQAPAPRAARKAPVATGAGGTPEGTWSIVFHHPAGDQDVTLIMEARDGRITGSATNQDSGLSTEITDGTIDGPRFSCACAMTTPVRMDITYDGVVDGDTISGDVTIKGLGALPFEGARA